jgi:RibD C-terminal domain
MRELIVNTFATLDGVMQAPGGPEEDPSSGFDHGGWSFGYWDELMQRVMGESMSKPFDLVLGRKTYEIFAAFWPNSDAPGAEPLNRATKHVASTTLKKLGVGELEADRGRGSGGGPCAQGGGRPRASGARQREPDSDAARAWAHRRVPLVDLPARARDGKASV